ncbi:MAG: 1-acyl-sn-glycerol-3-phosphate acyltransferase [Acidobacteriota bacterium]
MFIPLYILIPLAVLAAIALLERILLPGVRVVLRRQLRRLAEELNARMRLRLQPFKLTRKRDVEAMVVHDPEVARAAKLYREERGLSWDEVMDLVRAYAREIVPTFNVLLYYRLSHWLARRIVNAVYRVRVGFLDKRAIAGISPDVAAVFVMNHRSNFDYVLVSFLVSRHAALSYAVGEWARVWPLDTLIRRLGAYFVRRGTPDPLYRKVLERYVQLSIESGVTQGIFPEGGLTRDGRLRQPKAGLLHYVLKRFDPQGPRDLVFIPVGINYDRVFEDRSHVLESTGKAAPVSVGRTIRVTLGWLAKQGWLLARRRLRRFGYATVNFGLPISTRAHLKELGKDLRTLSPEEYRAEVSQLAERVMAAIARAVPVAPVPLVASAVLAADSAQPDEAEVRARFEALLAALPAASTSLARTDPAELFESGVEMLALRHVLVREEGRLRINPEDRALLEFYANSIAHLMPGAMPAVEVQPRPGSESGSAA